MDLSSIESLIKDSIKVKTDLLANRELLFAIQQTGKIIVDSFNTNGKLLLCGNGGSAADAQHIAAELTGRFVMDRDPLFAEALTVNTSYITAVANDYGYDAVFERMVRGKGAKGDVLIGLSTSGNSSNVVKSLKVAREMGLKTIAMTGASGGGCAEYADILINVPSRDTARIQESHILIGHILCADIEQAIFGS